MFEPVRLLIVEDDENIRRTLADVLRDANYSVMDVENAMQAQQALSSACFDVVILDLMLPDQDGYQLARSIKKSADARILMLTARSLEDDVVKGFESGADDYLQKPYRLKELLARLQNLAHRAKTTAPKTMVHAFGNFVLNEESRTVVDGGGNVVEFTPTEYLLLHMFLSAPGKAFSRSEILDHLRGRHAVVEERTVDNFVSSVKKKLGWHSEAAWRIKSVRGLGYRMEVER